MRAADEWQRELRRVKGEARPVAGKTVVMAMAHLYDDLEQFMMVRRHLRRAMELLKEVEGRWDGRSLEDRHRDGPDDDELNVPNIDKVDVPYDPIDDAAAYSAAFDVAYNKAYDEAYENAIRNLRRGVDHQKLFTMIFNLEQWMGDPKIWKMLTVYGGKREAPPRFDDDDDDTEDTEEWPPF